MSATPHKTFFALREQDDSAVEHSMLALLRRELGDPTPIVLPRDHVLMGEGVTLTNIWLLIEGSVCLSRAGEDQNIIFHRHSVGCIIGVLALAYGVASFFECRTMSEVQVIPVSFAELESAMQRNAELANLVAAVVVRSLARRSRRAVELQMELNEAHTRLVKNEKMATLGQLAAGVAHELNNPIAAIVRTTEHLRDDLTALVKTVPEADTMGLVMQGAMNTKPVSTREERTRRERVMAIVKDDEHARRLARAGITTREEVDVLLGHAKGEAREARIESLERYHRLGGALRNLRTCAQRIEEMVRSLRAYARPGNEFSDAVDLREGIEDTLRLFGHELRGIEVLKHFDDILPVPCNPGEINQVWTNLLSNAIEALHGEGTVTIETCRLAGNEVCVRFIDSGSGITPENLRRIFDVNFTTRQGPAGFGLGIGLPICKEVVDRHGGQLRVSSRPGRTCFEVCLPAVRATDAKNGGE